MKDFLAFLLVYLLSYHVSAQKSFDFLLLGTEDQIPGSLMSDNEGNTFCTVVNFEDALLIKLDDTGNLVDSNRIVNPDGACELIELVRISDSSFAAFGNYMIGEDSHLWFVKFDLDLSILINKKIPVEYPLASLETHAIQDIQNDFIIASAYKISDNNLDIVIFRINQNGMLITARVFQDPILNFPTEIIFDSLNNIYKVFILHPYQRVSPSLLNLDTNFNIINQAPYFTEYIDDQNSAKWLNDTSYILTGKYVYDGQFFLGALKVSHDSVIDTSFFGKENIIDWPGIHDNLDYVYPGSIYYVGFQSPFIPNNFIESPSHIMVNKLNSDLKLSWQKYFGGDAYYMVKSILATSDSGVVIASSRYDYLTQNMERDVHIFKVNKNGLITGVDNAYETGDFKVRVCPNPFKKETCLHLQFNNPGSVKIIISDIQGKRIKTLHDSYMSKGEYQLSWNGTNKYGNQTPDGIYLMSIYKNGEFVESVKVLKTK